jgi:hypothetical protein
MWSIMCSPISTVITQWDSRGLSMVGRSIALHFACNILECKICIVPMLLKVLEHWFPFFPNFVFLKTCSSGCDSCPDHQHDWRGSFPCYCKAFGGDNRGNLPQILVLKFVHCWVLSSSLSKFVVAISCHFPFWIDTLVMILWRPEPWPFHSLSGFQGGRSLTDFSRRRALPRQRDGCFRSEWLSMGSRICKIRTLISKYANNSHICTQSCCFSKANGTEGVVLHTGLWWFALNQAVV